MTDDIIHSTKYYIKYINSAILAKLQCRPLQFGRLMALQEKTHKGIKNYVVPMAAHSFPVPNHLISIC